MAAQKYLQISATQVVHRLEQLVLRQKEDILGQDILNTVPITDCGEELVKLVDYVGNVIISMTSRRQRIPDETLYSRRTVAQQLAKIATEISPDRIKVFDAFRPIDVQQRWFEDVYNGIKKENPTWQHEQLYNAAIVCIFPPSSDRRMPPLHSTGGAIDLTLTDSNGRELDMGTIYSEFDNPKMHTNSREISPSQRSNRVELLQLMGKCGFVNYPGEWWHFSFGDRDWVAYTGLSSPAIYGRAEDQYTRSNL